MWVSSYNRHYPGHPEAINITVAMPATDDGITPANGLDGGGGGGGGGGPFCGKYYHGNRDAIGWAYDAAARGVLLIGAVFLSTAILGLAQHQAGEEEGGRVYGMRPSSLVTVMTTAAGFVGAVVMPALGAIVDHTPHRRPVALWSALLLVIINGVQAFVSERTWFAMAILSVINPVVFLVHLVVVFAYLSELTDDRDLLTRWCGSFVAVRSVAMIVFLAVVVGLSSVWPNLGERGTLRYDVGTARIAQVVMATSTAVLFVLAFRDGRLKDRPALRDVPPGRTLVSAGFVKLGKTLKTVATDFPALRWYSLAIVLYGAPMSSFVSIAITFTTDYLEMNSTENGITILAFLLAAVVGSKMMPLFAHKVGLLTSMKASILTWAVLVGVTAGIVRGPEHANVFYVMAALWGFLFGWAVPNGRMVYIAIIPQGGGQEAEMMGLFQFFARGFLWLPPLIFTVLNERGVEMNLSILILAAFFVASLICMVMMGSFDDAVEHANSMDGGVVRPEEGRDVEKTGTDEMSDGGDAAPGDVVMAVTE